MAAISMIAEAILVPNPVLGGQQVTIKLKIVEVQGVPKTVEVYANEFYSGEE